MENYHGDLNRAKVIELAGVRAVEAVEAKNCELTSRVRDEFVTDCEFSASVKFTDAEGAERSLTAYYYPENVDIDNHGDDLSGVDWEIYGYEIW